MLGYEKTNELFGDLIKEYKQKCTICNGEGTVDGAWCECYKKARIMTTLIVSEIPEKYLDEKWSLENTLFQDQLAVKKMKKYTTDFAKYFSKGNGLLISGGYGVGKTTLASLGIKELAWQRHTKTSNLITIYFTPYDQFLKMSYDKNNNDEIESIINNINILILDNIGDEPGLNSEKRSSVTFLERILRVRESNNLPTIITTRLNLKDIKDVYNDIVYDLIFSRCLRIEMEGNNYRLMSAGEL